MRKSALITTVLICACSGAPEITAIDAPPAAAVQPLFATLYSSLREPRRMIIRDEESWSRLWADMVSSTGAPGAVPKVDFAREDVLVAALGERRTAGYAIAITGARSTEAGLHVTVISTNPAPGCTGADVVTTPLAAVRVSKIGVQISFDERTVVLGC
ncbi:MAG: protease complex subunit PrcB family protein [Gemmatimonadota bacterium]